MRRRIIVSLGLLLALFLLGSVTAIVSLHRSAAHLGALVESHRIQSMREHLAAAGLRVESDLLADLTGLRRRRESSAENERGLARSLDECLSCHHERPVQGQLEGLRQTFEAFQGIATHETTDKAVNEAREREALLTADRLVQQTSALAERAGVHLLTKSTLAAANVKKARIVLYVTLATTTVLGAALAFHLQRRLTKPMGALLDSVERIRRGDISARFAVEGDEEFRTLEAAFSQAYTDLKVAHDNVLHTEKLATAGKLAAGVAHEVLNPLASISSIVQLMRSRSSSREQEEDINLIMKETGRISHVLRDLQTFSRPTPPQNAVTISLDELIEHAANLIGYEPRAKKVAITRRFDPRVGTIQGDPDRLLLVCTNLMMNALDAMNTTDTGGGVLAIETRRAADCVDIAFRDNGCGMSEEQMARTFEPFFTTKPPGAGTGLGLWICHQVVEAHGGTIRLESQPGQGTTITLRLPCSPQVTH